MKKGQMESGELVMVMIIVIIMIILGIVVYSRFQAVGGQEDVREAGSLSTVQLVQEAVTMHEIGCGYIKETDAECLDAYRLSSFEDYMSAISPNSPEYNYYRAKFGRARIEVQEVYPGNNEWTVYDEGKGASETAVQVPVYVYNATEKMNHFGYMTVVRYS